MMKSSPIGTSYADMIASVRDEINDRHLVLSGVFDERIKEFRKIKEDTELKLGMVKTLEDAAKVRADADAYAATTRAGADATATTAAKALGDANKKMTGALAKEKEMAAHEEQALALMADYQEKADAFDGECKAREAAVQAREDALKQREEELRQEKAAWIDKQQRMANALSAARDMATSA